jgi:hypothetical protein
MANVAVATDIEITIASRPIGSTMIPNMASSVKWRPRASVPQGLSVAML